MCSKNQLKVFDIKANNINGGSLQFYVCKNKSNFKQNYNSINKFTKRDKKYKLGKKKTYIKFINRVENIRNKLKNIIRALIKKNKIIHGYGASTKGNVLLQYFNLSSKEIKFIAEKNPQKYNLYTPGSKIKIISEKLSRSLKPDYYLVLPWHFKNEILIREKNMLKKNTKFIFPLPNLKIMN